MKIENYMAPSSTGIPAGHFLGTFSTERNPEAWGSWFGKDMKERCQNVQSGLLLVRVAGFSVLAPSCPEQS